MKSFEKFVLLQKATEFLTKESHRNEPNYLATSPFGESLEGQELNDLKMVLQRSFVTANDKDELTLKQQRQLDAIFEEKYGQTLARFAQLLVREWVLRVRLGACESACYNAYHDQDNNTWK